MRLMFVGWTLSCLTVAVTAATHEGLKIIVLETFPAGTIETTEYVAGDRTRVESRSTYNGFEGTTAQREYVQIRQCDRKRLVLLDVAGRTYRTAPLDVDLNALERAAFSLRRRTTEQPAAPTVTVETTTVDTGDRKTAFGYPARRVITTRREIVTGHSEAPSETVTDGWYIDLETRPSCERSQETGRTVLVAVTHKPGETSSFPSVALKDIGTPERGFPIEEKTMSKPAGTESSRQPGSVMTHRRVTYLAHQPVEASLFDVPAGFAAADSSFSRLAARLSRTTQIIGSTVASWFR